MSEKYLKYTLPNGIRLVFKKSLSSVGHLGFIVNTGSRDEAPDEIGMAHFIEHTLFKGTKKRKAYQIINRLEDVGGELDAFTTKEETFISATFLQNDLNRAMELLSDIVFNSTFPQHELEKEKDVVIDEINSYKDLPAESIFDEFENMIFENHPIGHDILGDKKTVKSFNTGKILKFIEKNYSTSEMVLSVIGNYDFDKLTKSFEKYFAGASKKELNRNRNQKLDYTVKTKQKKFRNIHQSHCIFGCPAYDTKHKNRINLILLNNILGGPGMNSILNMLLREKHGLVYNIESNFTNYSDTGFWAVYLATEKQQLNKAVDLIHKSLNELREKEISNYKLNKAKKQMLGQIAISSENFSDYTFAMAKSELLFGRISTMQEISESLAKITSKDIQQTANEIFNIDNMSMLVYE